TDGPYLVPEPIRSRGVKINRPEYVKIIAEKISDIKGISSAQVASQTTLNATNFFSLKTND
ncbi:MAG: Deoxyribonuclease, TatD-related protein, partial [Patescibacteria group bacterium]|nr:Deoxyribonuclease, TatD-related protein [Patescibacteria group bacterium]